jgi:hypothetical protein
MALGITNRGTGTHNTSATTFTLSPSGNFAANSMAVLCIAADNAHSGGTQFTTWKVTDTLGNTWTLQQNALIDPGAASAGQAGAIFTTPQDGGALTTGTTITVTFDTATTAKTWTMKEITAASGKMPSYVTGNVGTSGTGTTSPTITTGTIPVGDVVIGSLFLEAGTTESITADADSTNGSWSTQQTAQIGSTTSGSCNASQGKVQTTTPSTQTYNPTLSILGDLCLAWVQLTEVDIPKAGFFLVF